MKGLNFGELIVKSNMAILVKTLWFETHDNYNYNHGIMFLLQKYVGRKR